MEKEFINYSEALALKELGFDEPCIGFWWNNKDFTEPEFLLEYCEHVMEGNLKRPLYQQVFRWFRDKHLLHPHICYLDEFNVWHWDIYKLNCGLWVKAELRQKETYEEAELECLNKLISIVNG